MYDDDALTHNMFKKTIYYQYIIFIIVIIID